MVPPPKTQKLAITPCEHPELIVDAARVEGYCPHCKTMISGSVLVEFLLERIEARTEELVEAKGLLAKYERVILSNSVEAIEEKRLSRRYK